jgi:hypothetical protein
MQQPKRMSSHPPPPEEIPFPPPGDDLPEARGERVALGAEWTRLATELDARAAAWLKAARGWPRGSDTLVRGAAARVEWAAQRTHDLTTWLRQAAKDLTDLT